MGKAVSATIWPDKVDGRRRVDLRMNLTDEEIELMKTKLNLKKEYIDDAVDSRATNEVMGFEYYKGVM